ncbi:MAG: protein kinase [Polyangiaceae bacterium]
MSQRFVRCPYCGIPHDERASVCPATGRSLDRRRSPGAMPAVPQAPSSQKHVPSPRSSAPASVPQLPPPTRAPSPALAQKAAKRDLQGKTIGGKYLVKSVLGEGGMGSVYEAEHLTLGRAVAVKVLSPQQARKKDAVKRFHHEARAAGAIGHPNICEVYDFGTLDDGSPYLVMERLTGETLAERIAREGGLPPDDVIDILVQMLSGLVAAHEKGVVHRDIKPENIFLSRRVGCPPVVKLLDFGVSKMLSPVLSGGRDEDMDLTRTGMVMGTPYYMAPEQARGDRNLDVRVDLWAAGVILYETLTGRRPFQAANYNALLLLILSTAPRPATEVRPSLPIAFDAVIGKAMSRTREHRYQSADEFQTDLQALRATLTKRSNAATQTSESMRARPPARPGSRPTTSSSADIPITFAPATPDRGERAVTPPPRSARTPTPEPRGATPPSLPRAQASPVRTPPPSSRKLPPPVPAKKGSTESSRARRAPPVPSMDDYRDEDVTDLQGETYKPYVSPGEIDATTEKRGPELELMLASAQKELRASQEAEAAKKPRARQPSLSDDTVKMGSELEERLAEARRLLQAQRRSGGSRGGSKR